MRRLAAANDDAVDQTHHGAVRVLQRAGASHDYLIKHSADRHQPGAPIGPDE